MTRSASHKRAVSALASALNIPRRVAGNVVAKRKRCVHVAGRDGACLHCGAMVAREMERRAS